MNCQKHKDKMLIEIKTGYNSIMFCPVCAEESNIKYRNVMQRNAETLLYKDVPEQYRSITFKSFPNGEKVALSIHREKNWVYCYGARTVELYYLLVVTFRALGQSVQGFSGTLDIRENMLSYKKADVLIINHFGAENINDYVTSLWSELFDFRKEHELKTYILSDVEQDKIVRYGKRLCGIIKSGLVFKVE